MSSEDSLNNGVLGFVSVPGSFSKYWWIFIKYIWHITLWKFQVVQHVDLIMYILSCDDQLITQSSSLKLNIQKTKIMASGPITSWQIDGETMEQWETLFWRAAKSLQTVSAAMKLKVACSFEEKLWLTLDSILKSRDITLLIKIHLVKAMVFPVVMYGCESWTIKLSAEELMPLHCVVGEDSWESLGLQGDPTSPS